MPINRSEQFHKRGSDAMRLISGAIEKAKEAPNAEIVEALKEAEKPIVKAPPAKPQVKQEQPKKDTKSKRDKRVTLYLTEEEYERFREQAFRRHMKLNEVIVQAAKKNMGRMPNPPKKYTENVQIDPDIEENPAE